MRLLALLASLLLLGGAALGLGLRAYTVAHLPLRTVDGVGVTAVMRPDMRIAPRLVAAVRANPKAAAWLGSMEGRGRILAYIVPVSYIMQGMIADTGPQWQLFRRHETFAMITNYVLHPIRHLQGMAMYSPEGMSGQSPHRAATTMLRPRL